ncbi:carboxyl transferase domain-containing protein, partial [Virgibacillus salexigens]|uniref:carboxyl transferase domain-containing protein n=1 Tax=Virgibacillus salexigens TaxID=61016 RepID=UPI0027E4B4AD
EQEAIAYTQKYLDYFPKNFREKPTVKDKKGVKQIEKNLADIIPTNQNVPFNMYDLIDQLIDEGSFCEIKKKFAPELITGLARMDGRAVGIIANQPR